MFIPKVALMLDYACGEERVGRYEWRRKCGSADLYDCLSCHDTPSIVCNWAMYTLHMYSLMIDIDIDLYILELKWTPHMEWLHIFG